MDQFYFQYEWTPALRRRTRIEIEKSQRRQHLELINVWLKMDAFGLFVSTAIAGHVWLINRFETLQILSPYTLTYVGLFIFALIQISAGLKRPPGESLAMIKNQRIRSQWWMIPILACLIPAVIWAPEIGINIPGFVIYPLGMVVHELIILCSDFRQRRGVIREIREMQLYIQQELSVRELPSARDLNAI